MTERVRSEVLQLKPDICANVYGVDPCTAGRVDTGTAQAGSSTSLTLRAGASAVDDAYNGMTARLADGRERVIADYVGATKVATVAKRWPTNYLRRSRELEHAAWSKVGCTIDADAAVSPDGSNTADRVNVTGGTNSYVIQASTGITAGTLCRYRVKAKSDGANQVHFEFHGTRYTGGSVTFNVVTGTKIGGLANDTIFDLGDGWYECYAERTCIIDNPSNAVFIRTNGAVPAAGEDMFLVDASESNTNGGYIGTTDTAVTLPDATTDYTIIDRPNACYNTFRTCQDEANYVRSTKIDRFTGVGAPIDKASPARPYIKDVRRAPVEIDPEQGLARRSDTAIVMVDEPCPDVGQDPYVLDRATPAQGTYWRRWLARNANYTGRDALLSQAYVDHGAFGSPVVERYILDRVRGQDSGGVTLTLRDPAKRLEKARIPALTTGRLSVELKAAANSGTAQAGTSNTITLADTASAIDDAYNGMEITLLANQGAGQRRIISDYVGATRVATLSVAWDVTPSALTTYEVGALQIVLGSGEGTQYTDPVASGARQFVRVGEEIIEYTAIATDTLTFPSTTYRAQFGTTRADAAVDDNVQLCRAFLDDLFTDVVIVLLDAAGYTAGEIDTAGFTTEDENWLGDAWRITAVLSEPEAPDDLLEDLLPQADAVSWWDPIAQKQKFKVLLPNKETVQPLDEIKSFTRTGVETLDDLRVTSVGINFGLADATANLEEAKNFRLGEGAVDLDALSDNEYGPAGPRPLVLYSRWFTLRNQVALRAMTIRKRNARRDAPRRITGKLDPKDASLSIGQTVDLDIDALTDFSGAPQRVRCMITRVLNDGNEIDFAARTTAFNTRAAFISPNGIADYPGDAEYAHISDNAGLMGNGDSGYVII